MDEEKWIKKNTYYMAGRPYWGKKPKTTKTSKTQKNVKTVYLVDGDNHPDEIIRNAGKIPKNAKVEVYANNDKNLQNIINALQIEMINAERHLVGGAAKLLIMP